MTLTNSHSDIAPRTAHNFDAQNFNRLQTDLVSRARIWAVDEVGAAMAHQLNEPLTALLLYLHEIKARGEHSTGTETIPNSIRDMVDLALRETQRVCDIMERLGHTFEAPTDAEAVVARGREAIESWTQRSNTNGNGYPSLVPSHSVQHHLTPREREALALITGGASNKAGGRQMGISTRTFEVHRAHIMAKLGAKNAADLVRMALSEIR
jgi:DNA-binding CsgD family transcriptional regulator